MAHFSAPNETQIIPQGVRYLVRTDAQRQTNDEVWKVEIPTGAKQVSVNLLLAAGLIVTSNNTNVIDNPIPESGSDNARILRLSPVGAGTTLIEVKGPDNAHWLFLQVLVQDVDPTRAAPQGPAQGSGPSAPPQAAASGGVAEPVAELLGLVSAPAFTSAGYGGVLGAQQVLNVLRVFLHAHIALLGRKLPAANAIFLPSHTGIETTFGTLGPNAPILNWFSVQVDNKTYKPLQDALVRRGATISWGDRGNRVSATAPVEGSSVGNPAFTNVHEMVDAQLDLVYGAPKDATATPLVIEQVAPFKPVGLALMNDTSAFAFGTVMAGAGYAGKGAEKQAYPESLVNLGYDRVIKVLKWFLGGPLAGASETTRTWARATLSGVARRN
jgi:hypothetical protein